MGLKYADATGAYSDPAKSGLKGVRADGQWANPDMDYKWLDSEGNWTVPELIPPIPTDQSGFEALTWEQMAALSAECSKNGSSNYKKLLGFTKDVNVTGVGTVKAKLIGLNHDTYTTGGKAGFTFQLTDGPIPLSMCWPINDVEAPVDTGDGWITSIMRTTGMPTIKAALPSDLQSVIKKVTKKTNYGYKSRDIRNLEEELFVLSLVESVGTVPFPSSPLHPESNFANSFLKDEGTQYEYYAQYDYASDSTAALKALIISNNQSRGVPYWSRSIVPGDREWGYGFNPDGSCKGFWPYVKNYTPAAFCI